MRPAVLLPWGLLLMACSADERRPTRSAPTQAETRARLVALTAPRPRRTDPQPVIEQAEEALPEGTATFEFWIDTGGDQMGQRAEVGLGYSIRYASVIVHQTVASCDAAGFGEPPPENGRAEASCDGESVVATVEPGAVRVLRGDRLLVVVPIPGGARFDF